MQSSKLVTAAERKKELEKIQEKLLVCHPPNATFESEDENLSRAEEIWKKYAENAAQIFSHHASTFQQLNFTGVQAARSPCANKRNTERRFPNGVEKLSAMTMSLSGSKASGIQLWKVLTTELVAIRRRRKRYVAVREIKR